jgi:hypothetical protein
MVGEMSICPINWDEYYEHAEEALDIIWDSNLDDVVKERLEELLRVDTITGYSKPYLEPARTWADTAASIDDLCPHGASVAEVDWLKAQIEKLDRGTAL